MAAWPVGPNPAAFNAFNALAPREDREQAQVLPGAIDAALAATGGKVKRVKTPFPSSSLYVPGDGKPHAGIVMLHGSEGASAGFMDLKAIRFAEKGFAVMAYGYFGGEGTPKALAQVDLEKLIDGLEWLKASPHSKGKKVGLYGGSRGAELALLLASLLRDKGLVTAVGAHAPHATVVESFDPKTFDAVRGPDGRALPAWRLGGKVLRPGLPIELEKYEGPVFLSHGIDDRIWSVHETRELVARRKAAGRTDTEVRYLVGQGHNPAVAVRDRVEGEVARFFRGALA